MPTLTQRTRSMLPASESSCATAKTEQSIIHLVGKIFLAGMVLMALFSLKDIARYIRIKTM